MVLRSEEVGTFIPCNSLRAVCKLEKSVRLPLIISTTWYNVRGDNFVSRELIAAQVGILVLLSVYLYTCIILATDQLMCQRL